MSTELNEHLEAEMNEETAVVVSELDALKARADTMGLKYHPSISLEKLRQRVEDALNGKAPTPDDEEPAVKPLAVAETKELTEAQKRAAMRDEALKLIRVNITCMNPNKREYEGEILATGNSVLGTIKKYIPFNTVDGYHVPKILLDVMREKKCQIFVTVKNGGTSSRQSKLINEFAIDVLEPLTPEELRELARRQAVANAQEG